MRIVKPDWVQHENDKGVKLTIYSLSVHPDGSRFATGGIGFHVKIWNTAPLLHREAEEDPNVPKLLASMSVHNGNVMCVAWSHGAGQYLATGSDDYIVLIWELDTSGSAGSTFGNLGGGGAANVENWKVVRRLAGHASDVTDLAWAPENAYLATCGLDSTIYIWDGRTFDQLRRLSLHEGFVKGLTWDPAGQYLASQSDDKTMIIWKTSDWSMETRLSAPFQDSSNVTVNRRPSWSPDGSYVASANAAEKDHHMSTLFTRDKWATQINLVGHKAPIEVVKFNPVIFKPLDDKDDSATKKSAAAGEDAENTPTGPTALIAVGSQDRSITVWTTRNPRPMSVADGIFEHNVTDLDWSPDGMTLFASSHDGTVAILSFTEAELGQPMSLDENLEMLSKHGYKKKKIIPVESPTQLRLEEEYAQASRNASSQRIARLMGGGSSSSSHPAAGSTDQSTPLGVPTSTLLALAPDIKPPVPTSADATSASSVPAQPPQPSTSTSASTASPSPLPPPPMTPQKVTITKDGKKRIQPQFVRNLTGPSSSSQATPKPPPPAARYNNGLSASSAATTSANGHADSASSTGLLPPGTPIRSGGSLAFGGGGGDLSNNYHTPGDVIFGNGGRSSVYTPEMDAPFREWSSGHGHPSVPLASAALGNKRKYGESPDPASASHKRMIPGGGALNTPNGRSRTAPPPLVGPERRSIITSQAYAQSQIRLAVPKVQSQLRHCVRRGGGGPGRPAYMPSTPAAPTPANTNPATVHNAAVYLNAYNDIRGGAKPTRVTLTRNEQVEWTTLLPAYALLLTGNDKYLMATCYDGAVHFFTPAGRRVLPAVMLEATASFVDCSGPYFMCLTSVGLLTVWNLDTQEAVISGLSVGPALELAITPAAPTAPASSQGNSNGNGKDKEKDKDKDKERDSEGFVAGPTATITSAHVRPRGIPVLTTSHGQAYTYHLGMKAWLKVVDPWYTCSDFFLAQAPPPASVIVPGGGLGGFGFGASSFHSGAAGGGAPPGLLSGIQTATARLLETTTVTATVAPHTNNNTHGGTSDPHQLTHLFRHMDDTQRQLLTLDHLEHQLVASQALQSPAEFRYWLNCYAKRLADENAQDRIMELGNWLLGPLYLPGSTVTTLGPANLTYGGMVANSKHGETAYQWEPTILGFEKRGLLAEILKVLATNRELQRITTQFSQTLDQLDQSSHS
ncbi:HIR complex subunit [Dimargaris cristalligena]|nr:HIR complex subunit [Dimargaris cristalligena]